MQCQRRLQISWGKNIGNIFKLSMRGVSPSPTLWWDPCLDKMPNCVLPYLITCVVLRLSITKWATRISRERFELESHDFTGTSLSVYSIAALSMTSLTSSSRMLPRKKPSKMPLPTASGGISREMFKGWSPNYIHLSKVTGLINLPSIAWSH